MCAKRKDISGNKKGKGFAEGKRLKIDKMQRNVFIAVCITSIALSLTIVGAIRLVKYIQFNSKVIVEKEKVAKGYAQIQNDLQSLKNSISQLTTDENLESVARERDSVCDSLIGKPGKESDNNEFSINEIEIIRSCSALRVVPDALPSTKNYNATMTEALVLGRLGGVTTENEPTGSSSGGAPTVSVDGSALHAFGINMSLEGSTIGIQNVLKVFNRSIRNFDLAQAHFDFDEKTEWTGKFTGDFAVYYSEDVEIQKGSHLVCANKKSEKCKAAGGDQTGDQYGQTAASSSSSDSDGGTVDNGEMDGGEE